MAKVKAVQQQVLDAAHKIEEGAANAAKGNNQSTAKVTPSNQCLTKDGSIPIGESVTLSPREIMTKNTPAKVSQKLKLFMNG